MAHCSDKCQNQRSLDEIRILVLASLIMQIGLIFLAPLRKRSTNTVLTLALWLLYLTADYVATLALGNISRHTGPEESGDCGTVPGDLTVLWAPFLLLHLGGPDSITSYSVEDNELWWRHLLGLVVQVVITVYIFWQSPPHKWLWIPTIFVFIPGLIKFSERTHALRLGSKDNLKDKIISELRPGNKTKKGGNDNTTSNVVPENGTTKGRWGNLKETIKLVLFPEKDTIDNLSPPFSDIIENDSAAILEGFRWFNIFKRLLVDVTFSSDLLMKSQDRFADIDSTDALKLVNIELSFLYDMLHTKAVHIHSILGRVMRCSCLVSIIAALIVFHCLDMQKVASNKDIIITYILFGAGLSLEVMGTVLLVLSDWTVVALTRTEQSQCFASCITALVKGITLKKGKPRWARTIGQYNLVGVCLRDRDTVLAKIMRILKIKHKWDNMRESRSKPLLPGLFEKIMFTEAKRRAQNVHLYNVLVKARSYRGSKVLERHDQLKTLEWSLKREFDECIILWHLATDICYYNETSNQPQGNADTERDVGWKTSNYMVYLLTQQQSMMQLGYGKTRFEATCAVVKKKFKGKGKLEGKKAREELNKKAPVPEQNDALVPAQDRQPTNRMGILALKKILENLKFWGRRKDEEDKRKDEDEMGELLLKEALRLVEDLQKVDQQIRWNLISETWMEMLGYAAIHCDSYQHVKSLSKGGELLTHLWLLLSQMGVVEEHKMQQFQSRSV